MDIIKITNIGKYERNKVKKKKKQKKRKKKTKDETAKPTTPCPSPTNDFLLFPDLPQTPKSPRETGPRGQVARVPLYIRVHPR